MLRQLTRFCVDHWQFTLVLVCLLVSLGASAVVGISKSEDPPTRFPIVVTTVVLPGADAEEMEKLVAIPIEKAVNGLEDLLEVRSTSRPGVAVIDAEFVYGVDVERKFDEVVREVNAVRPTLPDGVVELDILRANTANANVALVALVSESADARRMEALAKDLRDMLERAPGVQEAEVFGVPQTEVRVSLDLARLSELRLPPGAIVEALRNEGLNAPIGAVEAGGRRFNVQASGPFDSLEEIRATPLRAVDGRALTVGDVANVAWANDEARHITRFKGERAVFVAARAKLGANVFDVRRGIEASLLTFRERLPPEIRLERGFDQAVNVAERLRKLGRDFAIAVFLVLLTLFPLGVRASLVVMISIPLSLAIGVLAIQNLGYTMNQLSIAGFILALGLLVDDSIVVTENIARRLREGLPPRDAAIAGVEEIDVAVIGCTATLLLAFLPLLFLPEGAGDFIRSLPVAVLTTIVASLIISLTIIPFLASRFLSPRDAGRSNPVLDGVMAGIHRVYNPVLHVALARPRATVAAGLLLCVGCFALAPRLGFSVFPESDAPQFMVEIELPQGSALSETDKAVRFVERELVARPEIAWTFANAGRGNPQVYYNFFPERTQSNVGAVYASFHKWSPETSPEVLDALREIFATYPGARIGVRRFENGPPIEAPIEVRVTGSDLAALGELAADVERIVRQTPGTRDVVNPLAVRQIDIDLNLDAAKAGVLGIPAGAAEQALRVALAGETVATFIDPAGDGYPVRVRLPADGPVDARQLETLYVWSQTGDAAPIGSIAQPRFTSSPAAIERFQQERQANITAFTQSGYLVSDVTADVQERLAALRLPPGYRISFGGQAEAASDSFSGLGVAILIATFGILAVLLLEFRTFAQMTVVAFVIPFGIVGGILALLLTGNSLSFTAAIGFVALIGIEIKNSILLVDFANKLRERGMALKDAVERAGEIRFLPVLLTSLTAIGGLTPLVLEQSPLFSPLAIVIIGGLISSTLLARIVTPAMYLLLAPKDPPDFVPRLTPDQLTGAH